MSGFLTSLLRKERNPGMPLQPRVGSQFESSAPARTSEPDHAEGWPGASGEESQVHDMKVPESRSVLSPRPSLGTQQPVSDGEALPRGAGVKLGVSEPSDRVKTARTDFGGEQSSMVSPVERPSRFGTAQHASEKVAATGTDGTEQGPPHPPVSAPDRTAQTIGKPPVSRPNTAHDRAPEWPTQGSDDTLKDLSSAGNSQWPQAVVEVSPEEVSQQPVAGVTGPREPESPIAFRPPSLEGLNPEFEVTSRELAHPHPSMGSTNLQDAVHQPAEITPRPREQAPETETAIHDLPLSETPIGPSRHQEPYAPEFRVYVHEHARFHPSAASPTIRVSIGRIEIRAQVPEQTRPKPSTPKPSRYRPPLTLDDYIKKRSGGT